MALKKADPTINIDITEKGSGDTEKENTGPKVDDGQLKKKRKHVCMQLSDQLLI
jgi:hypothetical protein